MAALLSNLSYAVSDNLNGFLSRRNSALKITLWGSLFGGLIYAIPAYLFFRHDFARIDSSALLWTLGTTLLLELGYVFFLIGMRKGSVVLTGVIGGSFPAVSTVTALIFFNETLNLGQALAVILVLVGIALSSMHGKLRKTLSHIKASALVYAFLAFLFWGVSFAIIRIPIEKVGWFVPQYFSNFVGIVIALAAAYFMRERKVWTLPKASPLVAVNAVLGLGGTILFSYAISRGGETSIVAPIAGSSPAVFAILAFVIFKEKLTRLQVAGVLTTLTGVIILSVLSG